MLMSPITTREVCDGCGAPLVDVFSMGAMPLANGLLDESDLSQPERFFPLTVARCTRCTLAQLRHVLAPSTLYKEYPFYTSASAPNAEYFASVAAWLNERVLSGRVLEIGSNDGTLLAALEQQGFDVVGVDPAEDQCRQARKKLVRGEVICDFWSEHTAVEMPQSVDVVIACNVLGHSDNLSEFLGGVRRVLQPNGLFVVEVQYLRSMLRQAAFELIYHEHVSYFDEVSLSALLDGHGFRVEDWEVTDAQCGTLRMWASIRPGGKAISPCGASDGWARFRSDVEFRRGQLSRQLEALREDSRRVCFLGAPAKATQLANYLRVGPDSIEFATDSTPAKQGRFIPGARIPIVAPEHLHQADVAVVAAWNFYSQIAAREREFQANGGLLICPTLWHQGAVACAS